MTTEPTAHETEMMPASTKTLRAVLYLRVSTPSQVNTDYDPEGISLPAQRLACTDKAERLGNVEIIDEYIEPGRSATSAEARPALRKMIARIKQERDVDMVIVYKLSRAFRNTFDDATYTDKLRKLGTTLVSATEAIDETPQGRMMHNVLAALNEFQSAELSADVRFKMKEKAKKGGTLGLAPLGYLNVIEKFEGRSVRTVAFDPDRSQLVKLAFNLYSSGDYSLEALSDELYDRGLRSREGRFPSTQVSTGKLAALLRDPYYIGVVTYKGEQFKGRHAALVTEDLFSKVQFVLEARKSSEERYRRRHHPIKGLVWCGACNRAGRSNRMYYTHNKGVGGVYRYFSCAGKSKKECDEPYIAQESVDAAMIEHYATKVRLPAEHVAALRSAIRSTIASENESSELLHKQIQKQLKQLDKKETNLIELAADGLMSNQKIKSRLLQIDRERHALAERLGEAEGELEAGAEFLEAALALLERPAEVYRRSSKQMRKVLNNMLFEQIFIDRDQVVGVAMKEPFAEIVGVPTAFGSTGLPDRPTKESTRPDSPEVENRVSLRNCLDRVAQVESSSNALMVGVLHHYSNRELLIESLRKLTQLPQRKTPDRRADSQTRLIRQPTSAEEATIITDYLSGQTIRSIGESMNFHRETIAAVLHRSDIPTRYHQRTPVDLDRAAELIGSGMTVTDTAAALGVGRTTLVKARRERLAYGPA